MRSSRDRGRAARLAASTATLVADGAPLAVRRARHGQARRRRAQLQLRHRPRLRLRPTAATSARRAARRARRPQFFTRVAERVTRALHQITADGLRLPRRPAAAARRRRTGRSPTRPRTRSATTRRWGQTWERAALLQGATGRRRPRRSASAARASSRRSSTGATLDYTTLEDLKQMKARVESALRRAQQGHQRQARARRHPRGRVPRAEPAAGARRQGRAHPRAQHAARCSRVWPRRATSPPRRARVSRDAYDSCATSSTRSSSSTSARRSIPPGDGELRLAPAARVCGRGRRDGR